MVGRWRSRHPVDGMNEDTPKGKYMENIQCAARITRHRAISLSPRGRPARRFDPQMGSDFESLGINFEARAVILGSWTLIFRISEMDVCFYRKKCLRGPPSKAHSNPFFTVLWFDRFFGVLYVVDFCDLIRAARECRRPSNHSAAPCKRLRVVVGTCLWRWPARSASRAGGRTDGRSVGAALRAAFGGA